MVFIEERNMKYCDKLSQLFKKWNTVLVMLMLQEKLRTRMRYVTELLF